MVPSGLKRFVHLRFTSRFSKKEFWLASTASDRKGENLDFSYSIPLEGTNIGHLGARHDKTIKISNFFDEMRLSMF